MIFGHARCNSCLAWQQDDGVAEDNSDEEGTAETKSESIGSDDEADEDDDEEDDEDPSRRLNVRTGAAISPGCLVPFLICMQSWSCNTTFRIEDSAPPRSRMTAHSDGTEPNRAGG